MGTQKKSRIQKKNHSYHASSGVKLLIGLVFAILVIFPLVRMLLYIDGESLKKVVTSVNFLQAVKHSVFVALIATIITMIIAYLLAVCVERSGIRWKGMWSLLLVLPMLIPSISHGMGLIVLLGNNGLLVRLLNLNGNIYGMWGIVTGSVMYSFPVAFLMIRDILKYEDRSPYEAATVLGIPRWRQFTAITFPYLRKPLISVVFAVFTLVVTDYGVPLMVGGKYSTIPVLMYQEVIGQLDFGRGAVYGIVLLIPAVVAFVFDLLNKDRGNSTYVTRQFPASTNKAFNIASYLYCGLMSLCVIFPILSFIVLGFARNYPIDLAFTVNNIEQALNMNAGRYLMNSILIAMLVSVLGVVISFVTAYFTARMKSKASKFLHLIAITSAAIPGIVLGLSYVIVFKGSFIYGTIAILIMVNMIHFFASPYLMMYNSLNKINDNLEAVGKTLGIGRLRMIKDVFIPQSTATLWEMASYFFVNCMMTISAVSFLATTANKPVALMINQFEAQTQLECAAVVSLAILLVNLLFKLLVYCMKKISADKKNINTTVIEEGTT